ncbi:MULTISPECIES: hypothetical protein [Ralstonia]|jgi:hypothetical protein|uniref:Uncharacterized protein n=1 Tax=Ralstonia pickettii OR214 TaxID=1264675 RepID=R0EBX2_RALPI|nr:MULTISPECIES: hypothetical protein [Ralstonia]ENZ79589.1 hypothetical protein OR214_00005 [Ralstonia pickettii OR214]MBL4778433.1 hypothetical protein [Ralstonia sp.]MCM3582124.1 hypothetical protein [Ralstonia pickettii]
MHNANMPVPVSANSHREFKRVPINGPMRNLFIETRRTTFANFIRQHAPNAFAYLALVCGAIGVGCAWYISFVLGVTR